MMTIFMVTNNYTPYSGGVVSSVQVAAHELRKRGHRVVIVTLDFLGNDAQEVDVVRLVCPIRFGYRSNRMALPWRPYQQLKALAQQYSPAIIHVHHPFLLGVAAQRVARDLQIPVVFTYHTLYEQYLHYLPIPERLSAAVMLNRIRSFCHTVDAVIVPSNSIKKHIAQQHGRDAAIVSSGIRTCFVAREKPLAKRTRARVELLCVCRFTQEKNITVLFDMLKRLGSGYRLTLIGYGEQQTFLEQYASEFLQLPADQVQFIIKPEKEIIAAMYRMADLFVFASLSETQGLVLAEAMAAGTPVIALRGPGVVDIVRDGVNGYCVNSADEMATKIKQVMGDTELHARLQAGAYEAARDYYPEVATQKLLEVYESLLNAGR